MGAPQLRDYQEEFVGLIRDALRSVRAVVGVLSTGAGKTKSFSFICNGIASRGKTVWLLAHRKEIISQISMSISEFDIHHQVVANDKTTRRLISRQYLERGESFVVPVSNVVVASVQTLVNRIASLPPPDYIIVDECFPAGTLIDGVPIESLVCGDMVRCYDHDAGEVVTRQIKRLFKSVPSGLITVHLDGGPSITCTPGHPLFTELGYVNAINLREGDRLLSVPRVRCASGNSQPISSSSDAHSWVGVLQPGVFKGEKGAYFVGDHAQDQHFQAENIVRSDGSKEPDAGSGCAQAGFGLPSGYWSPSEIERGKRKGDDCSTEHPDGPVGEPGSSKRARCAHRQEEWLWRSMSLQNRCSPAGNENRHRGGRAESLLAGQAGAGCKKGCDPVWLRVAGVEVHEPTSDGTFGGRLPDGHVYNFEVDEHHNYFVDDVLVHNCHHVTPGSSWGRVVAANPGAKIIGVTATPCRLDGKGLGIAAGGYFEALVEGISASELIERGFLCPYRVYTPGNIDVSGLRKRGGDYSDGELESLVDKPAITGNVVEHYQRICPGERAVVFAVSVRHAQHVADAFNAGGVPAAVLTGEMDEDARAEVLEAYTAGRIQVLCTVDIVSEGFDLPAITVVILLRPTASFSLYRQQVGRALRIFSGKEWAYIVDHVGNWDRHGPPDAEVVWSLDGVVKSPRETAEQAEPMKVCPKCFYVHDPAPICPGCGHVYETKGRELKERDGKLVELTKEEIATAKERAKAAKKKAVSKAKTLEDLQAVAEKFGYSPGWAEHTFWARREVESRYRKQSRY